MKNLLVEIETLMNRVAGTVDYAEYMKAHPKSKKQPHDPMFKQKSEAAPKAAPAKAAPKAPAKTPTTKASPLDHLTPAHKKGVEYALDKMREYGYPEIAKKVQSGKMTLEEAGAVAEDWNYHGLAAILRGKAGTDHALIQHAENRHLSIDLGDKEEDKPHYGTERNHMLDARYEAANHKQIGKETDRDRQRKLNALTYIHHHGLHDSETAKRLHKEVEANKDAYKKTWADEAKYHDENVASQKKELDNFMPDPKHPKWTKKDQQAWHEGAQKAKDKHHEIGKKLGLV